MKIIYRAFFLLLFLFSKYSFAQIPYATQQPKWSFPIYAQDALGKKDTVYIGYDPSAKNGYSSPSLFDTNFGEKWFVPVSANAFYLGTSAYAAQQDSVLKVDIQNNSNNNLSFSILLQSVKMPVTFKWDLTKLRSDSLPFPSQNPLPKAQLQVTFPSGNWWIGNPGTSCNISVPVIVSDTVNTSQCNCYAKDSMQILDPWNSSSPLNFYFQIDLVPWTGSTPTGLKANFLESEFKIYTDLSDNLNVIGPNTKYKIDLTDMFGNILYEQISKGNTIIKVETYSRGVYAVRISKIDEQLTEVKKIILK